MSQSAALLAARASSGSAATCSGRGITSQLAIPRAHLASAPLQSQSRALAAAGRRHALRTGTSGEGARLRQNTALPMSHPSGWGQQHCSLRNSAAPPRAMGNYEDEEEDEEEEMDTLDEDDIVPGAFLPSIATLLLRCCLFSTSVGGGGESIAVKSFQIGYAILYWSGASVHTAVHTRYQIDTLQASRSVATHQQFLTVNDTAADELD